MKPFLEYEWESHKEKDVLVLANGRTVGCIAYVDWHSTTGSYVAILGANTLLGLHEWPSKARAAQPTLFGGSERSLATWPRSGSMRDGMSFRRQTVVPSTSGSDSGLWPTPVASDTSSRKTKYSQGGTPLSYAVRMWPTPQASDNRNRGTKNTPAISRRIDAGKQVMLSMCMDGPLNPPWVEWLMGWPIGWSDLQPLEMDKFQSWQQQHSQPC